MEGRLFSSVPIRHALGTGALALAGFAMPAYAQVTNVEIDDDDVWEHQWTEMAFPAQFGPFRRNRVSAFEERETNISANYNDEETGALLSLYIYRPGNPSTAIWFDRALTAIDERGVTEADSYGEVDIEDLKIRRFIPSGGAKPSGLFAVLAVEGNRVRSTGVALYRAGEWLVKVRISSVGLDVPQMDLLLKQTLNELPALNGLDQAPAQFISLCDTPFAPRGAEEITEDLTALALSLALLKTKSFQNQVTSLLGGSTNANAPSYCREGPRNNQFNLYRRIGRTPAYSVAVGDAGFSIDVFPDITERFFSGSDHEAAGSADIQDDEGQLDNLRTDASEPYPIAGETTSPTSSQDEPVTYAVRTADGLEYTFYTPYRGLPNLDQISQSVNGARLATASRPLEEGEEATITLFTQPE